MQSVVCRGLIFAVKAISVFAVYLITCEIKAFRKPSTLFSNCKVRVTNLPQFHASSLITLSTTQSGSFRPLKGMRTIQIVQNNYVSYDRSFNVLKAERWNLQRANPITPFTHFKTNTKSFNIYRVLSCCVLLKKLKQSENHDVGQANQRPQMSINDEHSIYSIYLANSTSCRDVAIYYNT